MPGTQLNRSAVCKNLGQYSLNEPEPRLPAMTFADYL